jgi:hypothetical protein
MCFKIKSKTLSVDSKIYKISKTIIGDLTLENGISKSYHCVEYRRIDIITDFEKMTLKIQEYT